MLHFFFGTYKNIHETRNLREDMREDYTTAWRLSSSFPASQPRGLYGSILSSVPHGRIVAVAALGLSQNHSSCHYASKRM